jgi:hypothetical protein
MSPVGQDAGMTTMNARSGRRRRRGPQATGSAPGIDVGPHVALDELTLAQIGSIVATVDVDAPWGEVAPRIVPVIRRIHQPWVPGLEMVMVTVPPGITTGFGVDLGPAFSHVTTDMVARWQVSTAELLATSLENLRATVRRQPPSVERHRADGVPVITIQGHGWGSSLLLTPDLLAPVLGLEPMLLVAPVRNVLAALPESVTFGFVDDLLEAFALGAPDALDAPILRWNGRAVVDLADASVSLPH